MLVLVEWLVLDMKTNDVERIHMSNNDKLNDVITIIFLNKIC